MLETAQAKYTYKTWWSIKTAKELNNYIYTVPKHKTSRILGCRDGLPIRGCRSWHPGDRLAESQLFTAAHTPHMTQNMYIHQSTKRFHGCLIIPCYLQSKIRWTSYLPKQNTGQWRVTRTPFISCARSLLTTVLRAVSAVPNVNRTQT